VEAEAAYFQALPLPPECYGFRRFCFHITVKYNYRIYLYDRRPQIMAVPPVSASLKSYLIFFLPIAITEERILEKEEGRKLTASV